MYTKQFLFLTVAIILISNTSFAEAEVANSRATPIELSIVPPAQFPPADFYVQGIRLSVLMGMNRKMTGLDLGVIGNYTEQEFRGLALSGGFNWNKGTTKVIGAQVAGLFNYNASEGKVYGIQASILGNQSKYMDLYGVQLGLYNRAREVYGLQLGLVNYASNLHGLQIGLANINDGGAFGVSPIINFGW